MATAVLQPTSLPAPRSMSTPISSASSSSTPSPSPSPSPSSSSQPLIDHALLMLTLSRRLSTTEHEQERAVEMREDALKLLVLGEEMQRAEERQSSSVAGSVGGSAEVTPPESPGMGGGGGGGGRWMEEMGGVTLSGGGKEDVKDGVDSGEELDGSAVYHLIPPAYIFDYPSPFSSSSSSSPSTSSSPTHAAVAAAIQSLPTTALVLSSPSSSSTPSSSHSSLSRTNSSTSLTPHLNPDAITASLTTLLTQADLLLARLTHKYHTYLQPLVSQSQATVQTLADSEEARVMVEEGRGVVREWVEFMGSREGDAMVASLLQMMAAQQLGVGDLIRYATGAVASVVTGSGSAAADTQSTTAVSAGASSSSSSSASSSSSSSSSSASSALVPVNPSTSTAVSTSNNNNHTFLHTLPEHIHSFLIAHPELNLFLLRAQSALLTPDPSSSSPPSELDQLLAAFSSRTSSLLSSLSSPASAHQLPNGKTQLLSPGTYGLVADLSSPLLHLMKSPERVFSEAVLLLMRGKSRFEQVLDDLKHLIIQQLSTALSNLSFPTITGGNTSFQYTIDTFALHSFHLHADDITLTTTDTPTGGRLVIEIRRVDAEAREVGWACKQLVFPYMSGSGTLDVRLREASMRVEVGVPTAATGAAAAGGGGGVRLLDLTFSFPSLSFHISNTSFSSVYNLLLSLFGPLLRTELERAVNVACRGKVEELLALVNEYGGGEVVRRWWMSSRKAKEEEGRAGAGAGVGVNGHAHVTAASKPNELMTALMADVMRDSAEDDRNVRLVESALSSASSSAPPSPTHTQPPTVVASSIAASLAADVRSEVAGSADAARAGKMSVLPSAAVDSFSTPPPPRHPSAAHRSTLLLSQSTPVSACGSPSSSSSSSSSYSSGRLTPSSSSPFLKTNTPPILLAYPDTASGW